MSEHPFVAGAKVFRLIPSPSGWRSEPVYQDDEVLKVHKTGRFTLKSDHKAKYGALTLRSDDDDWRAISVGARFRTGHVRVVLATEKQQKAVALSRAKTDQNHRVQKAAERLARVTTADGSDDFEARLKTIELLITGWQKPEQQSP